MNRGNRNIYDEPRVTHYYMVEYPIYIMEHTIYLEYLT